MKRTLKTIGRRYESGAIAIEAAFAIPLLLVFLGLPSIFLAFYFRQYTAAQKAVQDAAIYLSTAPKLEMTTAGPDNSFAALTLARKIIAREMAGVVPDGVVTDPTISCTYQIGTGTATQTRACTPAVFKSENQTLFRFDVSISFTFVNPLTGRDSDLLISPGVPVRYLGN
jgi:Flp pilus assembly protein TadG